MTPAPVSRGKVPVEGKPDPEPARRLITAMFGLKRLHVAAPRMPSRSSAQP